LQCFHINKLKYVNIQIYKKIKKHKNDYQLLPAPPPPELPPPQEELLPDDHDELPPLQEEEPEPDDDVLVFLGIVYVTLLE
jgi:hypothetical protein